MFYIIKKLEKMLTFWVLHVPLKNLSQTFRQWRCFIGFKKLSFTGRDIESTS